MSESPESEISRSEFISILGHALLKGQNDCLYEQIQHIDTELLYQHYRKQQQDPNEFALRFVDQLKKSCSPHSDAAFASLLARRRRRSLVEGLPPISPYQTYPSVKKDKNIQNMG